MVQPDRTQMTMQYDTRTLNAIYKYKGHKTHTHTHTEYVTLTAFSRQQSLVEGA
jgi:hypothetical protein